MAKRRPSGDGMVRKLESGRWQCRIVVGHKDNGEPIFRYAYGATQKELTGKLHQLIGAYQGAELTEASNMTLGEWLDQWLEKYAATTVRESTLSGYRRYAKDRKSLATPAYGDASRGQGATSEHYATGLRQSPRNLGG